MQKHSMTGKTSIDLSDNAEYVPLSGAPLGTAVISRY